MNRTRFPAASPDLARESGVVRLEDVTERASAEEVLRALPRRLLEAEDAERRRIARELHDSTAQDLIGVMLALDTLRERLDWQPVTESQRELGDGIAVLERCAHDLRTLAYVLHPPILDEMGLVGAIRDYVEGFGQRTGISIVLDLQGDFGRLPELQELVLFRVVQECLVNIHRHSGSRTASIRLARDPVSVRLEVSDTGQGAPLGSFTAGGGVGVGIAAMHERVHMVGGQLEIDSGPSGTNVRALMPAGAER
jgi:two-component system, NarL family, sensor kinase